MKMITSTQSGITETEVCSVAFIKDTVLTAIELRVLSLAEIEEEKQ
jgi:hypothetical protein